jgi:hypothetical protein
MELIQKIDVSSDEAHVIDNAYYWVRKAHELGLVVTVGQRPLMPPAMGHYEPVMEVRRARKVPE